MSYINLAHMINDVAKKFGNKTSYMYKENDAYKSVTFSAAMDRINCIAGGLADLGVKHENKVALLSENRLDWALSDYAILSLGAVTVPIYPSLLTYQVEFLLKDSESVVVIASSKEQYEKVKEVKDNCPQLKKVICMDLPGNNPDYLTLEELVEKGTKFLNDNPDYISEQIEKINPDTMASIIYTSGTTGDPKGAMLTHKNFLSNIEGALNYLTVDENDTFLSFLPLSHVFERMAGHYLASSVGATIAYAESIDTVAQNMQEVHPTVMTSVPRLYEKIYSKVLQSVEDGPALKRKIFYWAIGVGKQFVNKLMNKENIGAALKSKRNLAFKLVFSKLAERVGGKMRFFVSGGAPLSQEIGEFFGSAGLMIYEGYGLTETSPVISVNHPENFRFGSVGEVLPNVEVKIAEDGEILTRGPHVMLGYFKKPDATADAIDSDGWFYTGDIGFIDDKNLLTITDRKKNIIVTSGGKNIAPSAIENMLVTSKFIEQAMVIGDKRKFCSAIIVPAFENLANFAKENELQFKDYAELVMHDKVKEMYKTEIDNVNQRLASYETIKDFMLSPRLFSIESGELTPSLKIKRKIVLENFKNEIENIYKE